jgi:hypothetical protein
LLLAPFGLSACADSGDQNVTTSAMIKSDARQAKRLGYTEQAAILADGVITPEEYQHAFDLLRRCLDDIDMTITVGPYVNPINGLTYEFAMGSKDPERVGFETMAESGMIADCEMRYFTYIDNDYGGTAGAHMDPPLHAAVTKCLQERGFETTGEERTPGDFVGEAAKADPSADRNQAVVDCMHTSLTELYSDREIIGGFGW